MATAPAVELNIAGIVDGLTPHERRNFSFRKIIAYQADPDRGELPGLECEVSRAIAKQLKRSTAGFLCPTALASVSEPKSRSGLDTKTGGSGGYTVATDLAPDLIDLMRGKSLASKLGAQVLPGLTGSLTFAVKVSGTTVGWVGENTGSDIDQSDPVFNQRALVPKTAQATTAYSRKLLAQSSLGIERTIRNELAEAHAEAIDIAAIAGPGTTFRPLGILNCPGIGSVVGGTNGTVPTFANVIALESAIATNNADMGALAYLSTAGIRGVLKQTAKAANTAEMVWSMMPGMPGVGEVNGYAAYVTSHVPSTLVKGASGAVCHAIIFGDWSSIVIGEWGVLEVLVDPSRLSRQGLVEVTSHQLVDVLLKQPGAFAAMQDAKLS